MAVHTLPQHFLSFFKRLNPGSSFEATAASEYNTIKGLIEDPRGPAAALSPICFLQGSYRQQTAVYTINDVDIVALCRLWEPAVGTGPRYGRDEIFNIIAAPLRRDYRYSSRIRYGAGSMCIKVDLGIKVEILPVVYKTGNTDPEVEPFRLYRPAKRNWEDGYARRHQAYLSAMNTAARTGGNFIPAVKVLKHLRSRYVVAAVSFHLECLLYSLPDELFAGGPADYIPTILKYLVQWSAETWWEVELRTPCGERNIFNEWSLESWRAFHANVKQWAAFAGLASTATDRLAAIRYWRALLGESFFPVAAT